jgi:hypothetical protein
MRVLIAAGAAAEGNEQVPESVRGLVDSADEILVIAPELPTRTQWLVSDTDKARMEADERLMMVLGNLEERGKAARGEIGADDPMLAFEDAIREFEPDHIVIVLRSAEHEGWQEQGLLDKLVQRFGLPITVFMA